MPCIYFISPLLLITVYLPNIIEAFSLKAFLIKEEGWADLLTEFQAAANCTMVGGINIFTGERKAKRN